MQSSSDVYYSYKGLVCDVLVYILLNMYINTKKISTLPSGKSYRRNFNLIIILAILALSASIMLFGSTIIDQKDALPFVFLLIAIIIVLCLSAYRNICNTLEEQALDRIQLNKTRLELEYYNNVNETLNQLSLIRHDMKNHLILIDRYSHEQSFQKIQEYIKKINEKFSQVKLIKTPSTLISSILNAKHQDCMENNLNFTLTQDFSFISIDDYSMITILGNILDNSITAASKTRDGFVKLSLKQLDSYLEIICQNNHCEKLQKKEGHFVTSKLLNSHLHGMGLKSVEKVIDELNGQMDIKFTDEDFTISILIPNYK